MKTENLKRKLIVLEGMDKSGKSTAVNDLAEILERKNIKVVTTKQPGEKFLGDLSKITFELTKTDNYNLNYLSQMFSFLLDRSEHTQKIVSSYLHDGYTVISDRWWYSTIAYQVFGYSLAKTLGYTETFFIEMNKMATLSREPDWAFFLNGQSINHKDSDDIYERQGNDFFERVRSGYSFLIDRGYLTPIEIEIGRTEKTVERILKKIENT